MLIYEYLCPKVIHGRTNQNYGSETHKSGLTVKKTCQIGVKTENKIKRYLEESSDTSVPIGSLQLL